jgi:PhzF family phenazine biosynthesis protein
MQEAQREAIVAALGIPPADILRVAELDNSPVWQAFWLKDAESVLALDSARVRWPDFASIGLIGAHPPGGECDYEVRMLAPSSGMSEDPITGSLNSALAHWLQTEAALQRPITTAQGTTIGRLGRVYITLREDHSVRIGGQTHVLIEGSVSL